MGNPVKECDKKCKAAKAEAAAAEKEADAA